MEEFISGMGNNSGLISISSLPWPTNHETLTYNNAAFSSVILLAMAFTVIPAGFGVEVVRDRQVIMYCLLLLIILVKRIQL